MVNGIRSLAPVAALAVMACAATPVLAAAGDIRTVAGGGTAADGAKATDARMNKPRRVAFTPDGGLLVVEFGTANAGPGGRVRRVSPAGVITTVAGDGREAFGGDGGPATAASFNGPSDVILTPDGGYLVADEFNSRIRKVSAHGAISTVAGTGEGASTETWACPTGPVAGVPASSVRLGWPRGLAAEASGAYLVVDELCGTVQRIAPGHDGVTGSADDTATTVAAGLNRPKGVAAFAGGFYVADSANHTVVRVTDARVSTVVAGTGAAGAGGDGGPATAATLRNPRDVEAAPDGGFLIADSDNYRVRRVTPDGVITTIAGTGSPGAGGPAGDGGPAIEASLAQLHGVNVAPDGDVYVTGSGLQEAWGTASYRVRAISGVFPGPAPDPDPDPDPDPKPNPDPGAGTPPPRTAPPESGATPVVVPPPPPAPPVLPPASSPVANPSGGPATRVTMLPADRARLAARVVTLRWTRVAGAGRYVVVVRALSGARRGAALRVVTRTPRVRIDTRRLGGPGAYRWTLTAVGATPRPVGTRRFSVR